MTQVQEIAPKAQVNTVTEEQTTFTEAELPSRYNHSRGKGIRESGKDKCSGLCPVALFTGSLRLITWAAATGQALGTDSRTRKLQILHNNVWKVWQDWPALVGRK